MAIYDMTSLAIYSYKLLVVKLQPMGLEDLTAPVVRV